MKHLRADQEELGIKMFKEQLGIKGGSLARVVIYRMSEFLKQTFFQNCRIIGNPQR